MPQITVDAIAKQYNDTIQLRLSNGSKSIERVLNADEVGTVQDLANWIVVQSFDGGDISTTISRRLTIDYHIEGENEDRQIIIDNLDSADLPAFLRLSKEDALLFIDNVSNLEQAKTALSELTEAVYFLKSFL